MRTTLADARRFRIAEVIGDCPTGSRFLSILNEAQQLLLNEGHWWSTVSRFRICATDGCITLPRQIATIEKAAINGVPIPVHDQWFEWLENGWGTRNAYTSSCASGSCSSNGGGGLSEANYRGRYPCFSDIRGTDKKLRFICDLDTDIGKTVLALGYDGNGNWIRTIQGGVYADGELITLAQAPGATSTSTNVFSVLTDLQFPANMDGQTWLYEYKPGTGTDLTADDTTVTADDTTVTADGAGQAGDGTQRLIGQYQYDETRPSYARYFFPSIVIRSSVGSSGCNSSMVEILAKLDFIPAKNDTDYLIISNLPALKIMCQAINASDNEPDAMKKIQMMAAGLAAAKGVLDAELGHYLGSGREIGITITGSSIGAAQPVEVFI